MDHNEVFIDELVASIQKELENIQNLRNEIIEETKKEKQSARVLGSILHDFYNCCERIFKRISSEINGSFYQDERWHKELLYRMTISVKKIRPAVVHEELAAELDDYLAFRHVFRNIYGFELKGDRLTRLVDKFRRVSMQFENQVGDFLTKIQ